MAFFAIFNGDLDFLSEKTSIFKSSPITCNCSIAAGLYTSQATIKVFLPFFVRYLPSLPQNVVFPDPWRPDKSITFGFPSKFNSADSPPIKSVSSSATIFVRSWPGETEIKTFWPIALSFILEVISLATL